LITPRLLVDSLLSEAVAPEISGSAMSLCEKNKAGSETNEATSKVNEVRSKVIRRPRSQISLNMDTLKLSHVIHSSQAAIFVTATGDLGIRIP